MEQLIIIVVIVLFILLIYYLIKNFYIQDFFNNHSKNVIMTTYFCNKLDPQRNTKAPCNDINYIKTWYFSVKKLGLNGVIFHDGLNSQFINKYKTTKITFVYTDTNKSNYSLNDFRFIIYYDYIKKNTYLKNIFMTDGNDVKLVMSPFNKFNKLCVGSEESLIKDNLWIQDKIQLFNSNKNFYFNNKINDKVYNAGILGGNRKQVLSFLKNMNNIFKNIDKDNLNKNNNMIVFNYVIYNKLNQNVITGNKLHSKFRSYENNRTDVCFIHK